MIASQGAMCKENKSFEKYLADIIPFRKFSSPYRSVYQFQCEKLIRFVLKKYNVLELSTMKSIEMAATSDGAKLTARCNHLASFFKLIDPDLQDPSSKQFLFKDSSGMLTYINVQNRTLCILAQSVTYNETKQSVKDVLGDFYSWMLKVMKDGLPYCDN